MAIYINTQKYCNENMALPCESCSNRPLVQIAVDVVQNTYMIIDGALESIQLYEAQYNDPDLANYGPDKPSEALMQSMPLRREALVSARQKLEQHIAAIDSIVCGNLITCFKPALVDMVNRFALDDISVIMENGPQQ